MLLDVYDQEYGDVIEELPEHDFSPAFERKMKKLIRRSDHPIRYRVAQAAACLLLAALLSGCTVLAFSPEAREAFVGWVREVSERWFVYRYTGEERPTLENMVYLPTWVPEGYEEIVSPQVGTFVRTQYENSAKELLTISYIKGTETSSLSVEWAGAVVRQTSVGHLPADLYMDGYDKSPRTGFSAIRDAQMKQYVSPDRATPISQVSVALNDSNRIWNLGENILDLIGIPCTAKVSIGLVFGKSAQIYNADGEMIAAYSDRRGGWFDIPTADETRFQYESTQIYYLRNMNRNQYSRLLAELRDTGIITAKEYSAAYGGTLPQSSSAAPHWPYGKEEIDFVHFLDACVIYCEQAADNPELTAIYTKLRGIFFHIDHAQQLVT